MDRHAAQLRVFAPEQSAGSFAFCAQVRVDACKDGKGFCSVSLIMLHAVRNVGGHMSLRCARAMAALVALVLLASQSCLALSWHADVLPPSSLLQVAIFDKCISKLKGTARRQASSAAVRSAVPQHMRLKWADRDMFCGYGTVATFRLGV